MIVEMCGALLWMARLMSIHLVHFRRIDLLGWYSLAYVTKTPLGRNIGA